MKILTEEIALREETRALQQARPQLNQQKIGAAATALADTQTQLLDRTDEVLEKVLDLPDAEKVFAREIKQLTKAGDAMADAERLLTSSDTGPNAIAAETEAIEWLLLTKRSGSGGGGGGSDAGAGNRSEKSFSGSALARLGNSQEQQAKIVKRNTNQATGKAGRDLPEEFRIGLDQFFEKMEVAE